MAISLTKRRVLGIKTETTEGTQDAPAASTDALPLLREATAVARPFSTERETLRQTLTGVPDIYPGKSLVDVNFVFELHAVPGYTSGAGQTNTCRPLFTRVIQGCGYQPLHENESMVAYPISSVSVAGPMRHLETVTGASTTGSWRVIGDTFADDGVLIVDRGTGTHASGNLTGGTSGAVFNVGALSGASLTEVLAWYPNSILAGSGGVDQTTTSITLWKDGKKWAVKGAMGNIEFQFDHGAPVLVSCTFSGVLVDYTDEALPTTINESHKYPPTFLGTRMTLRQAIDAPTHGNKYGSDGSSTGGLEGGLSKIRLSTGNDVVFHQNALDPNGVNYAFITGRKPKGSFDPDEVTEAEFSFASRFVNGTPLRMRVWPVGPVSTSWNYANPTTQNQNGFDMIAPGIVFSGMADQQRDSIMFWDASFDLTGSDYNSGLEESLGTDNELVIVHR